MIGTLFSGGFFGVLFGLFDVEQYVGRSWELFWASTELEVFVFAPVGIIWGATIGFLFMTLRFCENKKRQEMEIFRSYGGTYIGYKDISLKSSDEEEETPMLGGGNDNSFYFKSDQSEIDSKYEA